MKNVECLLSGIKVVERKGAVVTEVSGVESDSRQVKKITYLLRCGSFGRRS